MSNFITIQDWKQFTTIVDRLYVAGRVGAVYRFRGQSDAVWGLTPSLLRYVENESVLEPKLLQVESKALGDFKSQAHMHMPVNELTATTDTISWWSVMQHHNAPTRLLDWTESIYVAAYFAVTGTLDKDGAIWLVFLNEYEKKMSDMDVDYSLPKSEHQIEEQFLKSDAPRHLVFGKRLTKSPRMAYQQGGFSICRSVIGDHGEILEDTFSDQGQRDFFRKLVIPAHLKNEFVDRLRHMNVSANSLFQGLDGLGKSTREYVQTAIR